MISNIDLENRKELHKTFVWSVATNGCKARTMGKVERRKLETFGKWRYRKLLEISRVDKVTNEEVLNIVEKKRSPFASI